MDHFKPNFKIQLLAVLCTLALIAGIVGVPAVANADEVAKISVDTEKTDLRYTIGSEIQGEDIYLYINDSAVSVQASTLPEAIVETPQNDKVGWKTVIVHYAGQTATYEIKVVPKAPSIYALYNTEFDTVKAYSTIAENVTGCNFRAREAGTTTSILMGLTTSKSKYGRYYDSKWMLEPGHTYYIKVRSYKVVNGENIYSNWSEEQKVTIPKLYGAEKWRYEAKKQLLAHDVYSEYRLDIIINIIDEESGGCETSGEGNYYVGLMQFGSHWKHDYSKSYFSDHGILNYRTDNRLSGSWSLHRVAHLIKYGGGTDALKQHWPSTWNG